MIYVNTQAGIGNKLKSLVTCLRMSDLYNDQVYVQFEHHNLLSIEQPNRPAQPKIITRMDGSATSVTGIKTGAWQLDLMPQDLLEPVLKQPKSFVLIRAKDSYSGLSPDFIDFQFDNISDHIIQAVLPYWNQIKYNTEILNEVDEICGTWNIHNRVGVHIRSQYENSKKSECVYDFEMFVKSMSKESDDFFVTSDLNSISRDLQTIFGDRIMYRDFPYEKHTVYNKNGWRNALIDLLLLSRCKKIIGSYQSTFTEVAWWINGCKSIVEIPLTKFIQSLYDSKEVK
jgi:hypothetical protein